MKHLFLILSFFFLSSSANTLKAMEEEMSGELPFVGQKKVYSDLSDSSSSFGHRKKAYIAAGAVGTGTAAAAAVGAAIAGLKLWEYYKINKILQKHGNKKMKDLSSAQQLLVIATLKKDRNRIKQLMEVYGNGILTDLNNQWLIPVVNELYFGEVDPVSSGYLGEPFIEEAFELIDLAP